MGTPVEENPFGVECFDWDPADETPKYIYCFFYDLLKGDLSGAFEPPNLHVFKMSQVDGTPCIWSHTNTVFGWKATFGMNGIQCWLLLQDTVHPSNYYFAHTKAVSPPVEYELFDNFFQVPWDNWGYGGHGVIFWLSDITWLATAFGFDQVDDLKLEIFADDADDLIIKFCSLTMRSNVKFKISR